MQWYVLLKRGKVVLVLVHGGRGINFTSPLEGSELELLYPVVDVAEKIKN